MMQYLSAADVSGLALRPQRMEQIAEQTVRGLDSGSVIMATRPIVQAGNGTRFMAFPAILDEERVAGVKWLGIAPFDATSGRQPIGSCIVLSAVEDGSLLALVDACWITAIRTAVVSLVVAKRLAHRKASRIAFIACGKQARYHLELFAEEFPIVEVACYSRRLETAERFAMAAREMGYAATAHKVLRDCVEGADMIVASSPDATATLMEPDWLAPGCFVSLVDLGRSVRTEALSQGDILVVDDLAQFHSLQGSGALKPFVGPEPLALSRLLQGATDGRGGEPKTFLLPTGLGAIDIAIAWELVKFSRGEDCES